MYDDAPEPMMDVAEDEALFRQMSERMSDSEERLKSLRAELNRQENIAAVCRAGIEAYQQRQAMAKEAMTQTNSIGGQNY